MGGWHSSNAAADKAKAALIDECIAQFEQSDCISHLDPDLPPFSVTDDYIALSLWQRDGADTAFDIPMDERLAKKDAKKSPITWPQFFDGAAPQKKYVISAPPGAGKSVLMHHMATDIMRRLRDVDEVGWPFDWVLLLHCRDFYNLSDSLPQKNWQNIHKVIEHLCFNNLCDGVTQDNESPSVRESILQRLTQKGHNTLLLLDGLDELPNGAEYNNLKNRLLAHFPRHVISGRPHALEGYFSNRHYGVIEITGFTPDAQAHYIERYAEKKDLHATDVQRMKETLAAQPDLPTYLPVILDIFCYLASSKDFLQEGNTELSALNNLSQWYDRITAKLVQRYYFQRENQSLSHHIHDCTASDIQQNKLMRFLSALVLTQKINPVITLRTIHTIIDELIAQDDETGDYQDALKFTRADKDDLFTDKGLINNGFLTKAGGQQENYQFLHLTLQEFLLAKQLAYWIEQRDARAIELVRTNKYVENFHRVWPFTVGLLDLAGIERFLVLLLAEPHCATRFNKDNCQLIFSVLEGAGTLGLSIADRNVYPLLGQLHLMIDEAFDADMLKTLEGEDFKVSSIYSSCPHVFFSCQRRMNIGYSALERADEPYLKWLLMIGLKSLPEKLLTLLFPLLLDKKYEIRRLATGVIGQLSPFSPGVMVQASVILSDRDKWMRSGIAEEFMFQLAEKAAPAADIIFHQLIDWQAEEAEEVLADFPRPETLPTQQEIVSLLPVLLSSKSEHGKLAGIFGVEELPLIPNETLPQLLVLLKDEHESVREAAFKIVATLSSIPCKLAPQFLALLNDENEAVQQAAYRLVIKLSLGSPEPIVPLDKLLSSKKTWVRSETLEAAAKLTRIPPTILSYLPKMLNKDLWVRCTLRDIISTLSSVPREITLRLCAMLDDDEKMCYLALEIIEGLNSVPPNILMRLVALLGSSDLRICCATFIAIVNLNPMPPEVVPHLFGALNNMDVYFRDKAFRKMTELSPISNETFSLLLQYFTEDCSKLRQRVQAKLMVSRNILAACFSQLPVSTDTLREAGLTLLVKLFTRNIGAYDTWIYCLPAAIPGQIQLCWRSKITMFPSDNGSVNVSYSIAARLLNDVIQVCKNKKLGTSGMKQSFPMFDLADLKKHFNYRPSATEVAYYRFLETGEVVDVQVTPNDVQACSMIESQETSTQVIHQHFNQPVYSLTVGQAEKMLVSEIKQQVLAPSRDATLIHSTRGEHTMEKHERKKEQPESENESTVMPQLSQVGKLAETIKDLKVGNWIKPGGKLYDINLTDVVKSLPPKERLEYLCKQMDGKASSLTLTDPASAEQLKLASHELRRVLANHIDNAEVLNLIEGEVFGNETAKYSIDKMMEEHRQEKAHDAARQFSAQLTTVKRRVSHVEDRVDNLDVQIRQMVADNVDQLKIMRLGMSNLQQAVTQITTQIKLLIQDRAEAELIRQLWQRIEQHPKLVAYCNTVRQALHQRFFKSHFIQAGGAVTSTGVVKDLAKGAVGQIPIAGFLAVAAVDVGLAAKDTVSNEIRKAKAERYVRCTESLKTLDILPELISLLLTCSYEEQIVCLKDKSVVSGTLPSAAGYGISLVEEVIQHRPKESDIPEAYRGSVLGLALSIVEQVPVAANRTLRQELFTMFGFDSNMSKTATLSLEKTVRGKADDEISASSWSVGSFYYKPGTKCQHESGELFYNEDEKAETQKYVYRWVQPGDMQLGNSVRAKPHPYTARYTDLLEQSPFIEIPNVLAASKAAQHHAVAQAAGDDVSMSSYVPDGGNRGSSASSRNESGLGHLMADINAQRGFLNAGAASKHNDMPEITFPQGITGEQKAGKFVVEIDVDLFDKVFSTKIQNILKGRRGISSSFHPDYKKTSLGDIYELIFSEEKGVKKLIAALNTLKNDWPDVPEVTVEKSVKKR